MASYAETKTGMILLRPDVPLRYLLYYPDSSRLMAALVRGDIKRIIHHNLKSSLWRLGTYCVSQGHGPRVSLQVARAVLRGKPGKITERSAPTARRHIDLLIELGVLTSDGPDHVCMHPFGQLGPPGDSDFVLLPDADDPFWAEYREARRLKEKKLSAVRRVRHRAKIKNAAAEKLSASG